MITVKIQCGCGQRYAFDVEPVNGRMSSSVACPACGTDGTAAANEVIAQSFAAQSDVAPNAGVRLRAVVPTPTAHAATPVSPVIPRAPIHPVIEQKSKLAWYEHVWIALPIALLGVGGAIGGACGGAAWAINKTVFKKTENLALRYVWTGLISVSAVVVYLVLAMFSLSLFHSIGAGSSSNNWKLFACQEGNFSALFPGAPKEKIQNELIFKVHSFVFEKRKAAYLVLYVDYPEKLHVSPTVQTFDGARNGALGKDGKLLQEKPITVEGFPGREIQIEKKDGEEFVVDRYFLAANRLYQVMVVVSKQDESSTNIPYFLNSFSLLKKAQ